MKGHIAAIPTEIEKKLCFTTDNLILIDCTSACGTSGSGPSACGTSGNGPSACTSASHTYDPEHIRHLLLSDPKQLTLLKANNPRLYDALMSGNLERFASVLNEQIEERDRRNRKFLPLEARIRKFSVFQLPKSAAMRVTVTTLNDNIFTLDVMLFINCCVNGVPVKAFVDSGAQTTIMSAECAERCAIMRLIDTRWAGVAKGVGIQRIIGRIHMVQVVIEKDFLTTSLSILEEQPMDMLLGLDMLRRHQCCIDLKRNVLRIGTTGTETRFLSESELPVCARLTNGVDNALSFGALY
ncbi:protein DDI1 homolog 1-like [Diaphorina citri]|uniref:Protein DDI1 homolog 1-like n=1 Tax=Diaphorina citri TaxID=121845 RepID=A0A3Q0JBX6_DIACI|nr:protein DDI1 homolog 1-like [Diaphorina citri]